jgi:hypothetical protein
VVGIFVCALLASTARQVPAGATLPGSSESLDGRCGTGSPY